LLSDGRNAHGAASCSAVTGVNELKRTWGAGKAAFGAWCSSGSPAMAEVMALEPFDYICFDIQHGLMGYDGFLSCLQAVARTGVTPLARVPANDTGWIGKVLDAGAHGVIVPMVNNVDDAQLAVANTRLFPLGRRSFGPIRLGQSLGRDPKQLNEEVACIVMIETAEGVANAENICRVQGVDGVYIGPADLALTLGLAPTAALQPGPHTEACEAIRRAAEAAGIIVGIHCESGASARQMAANGYRMLSIGSDVMAVRAHAVAELGAAR
jgi:4-hydroxy-2-oxoheptanedioate aldolase